VDTRDGELPAHLNHTRLYSTLLIFKESTSDMLPYPHRVVARDISTTDLTVEKEAEQTASFILRANLNGHTSCPSRIVNYNP